VFDRCDGFGGGASMPKCLRRDGESGGMPVQGVMTDTSSLAAVGPVSELVAEDVAFAVAPIPFGPLFLLLNTRPLL